MTIHRGFGSAFLLVLSITLAVNAKWEHTSGPGAGQILSVAVSGSSVFAGLSDCGVFISTNNGDTWAPAETTTLAKESVAALLITDKTLFAGTYNGLYSSTNNGQKWTATSGIKAKRFSSFAISGTKLFAGSESNGVYVSTNNGSSWTTSNSGMTDSCIFSLFANGTTIFAGAAHSIYRSTDNGVKWIKVDTHSGMCFKSITKCGTTFIAAASPELSAGSVGVLLSTDNGTTWLSGDPGLKRKKVDALATVGTTVFAGTWGEGVFASTDNGKNWKPATVGLTCTEINDFSVVGTTLFAATDGGVFRTANSGADWTMSSTGITKIYISSLTAGTAAVYAGTDRDGVFLSTDNGATWTQSVAGLQRDRIFSLAANGGTVYAGTDSMGIFRRPEATAAWTAVGATTVKNSPITDLSIFGTTLFAEGETTVFRSTDNGEQWTALSTGFPKDGGTAFVKSGVVFFTGADSGVYRSTDNGVTWKASGNGIAYKVLSLAVVDSTLFAGTNLHGIYKSTDNGANWISCTNWSYSIEKLLTVGRSVLGFSSTGIFLSSNLGATWSTIHEGIPSLQFTSLCVNDSMLFLGTRTDGIWRRPIAEAIKPAGIQSHQAATLPQSLFDVLQSNRNLVTVAIALTASEPVCIDIFNVSGARVATLADTRLAPGAHSFSWKTAESGAGCYLVRLKTGAGTTSRKIAIFR